MTTHEARLLALDALLDGEPPYPPGTVVRHLQDERDGLRTSLKARALTKGTDTP